MNSQHKAKYGPLPDTDLISLLRNGDHAAFTEIFNRYHFSMIAFALKKLGDEDLAKDLVQDIFTNLWVKRQEIRKIENLPAYLIVQVKRKALNLYDHEKVKMKYANSLAAYSLFFVENTDYVVREKQFVDYINKQIDSLPKKMRQSFRLSKDENLSNKEIAKKLNTSDNNISQHINNAIKILRTKLTSLF